MRLLTPLAAVLALAVAPSAAQAARVTYDVDVDLAVDYAHHLAFDGGGTEDDAFKARITGTIPAVRLVDGQFLPTNPVGGSSVPNNTGGTGQVTSIAGTYSEVASNGASMSNCTITGGNLVGGPTLQPTSDGAESVTKMILTPGISLFSNMSCTYDNGRYSGQEIRPHTAEYSFDALTIFSFGHVLVDLPNPWSSDQVNTVEVSNTLQDADCPNLLENSVSCRVTITGTVTFREKFFQASEGDDDLLAPPPPKVDTPKVDKRAKKVRTRATCTVDCRIRVREFLPGRRLGAPRA
ncbi:MAG TPA: hypothetical protein VIL49_08220, partial [Capillimicrobium sp.]